MKKTIVAILLLVCATAAFAQQVNRTKMCNVINSCRGYEGAKIVSCGSLGTLLLRGAASLLASGDEDLRSVLPFIGGIKSFYLLNYSECTPCQQRRITRKLNRILSRAELLIEARDNGGGLSIYGSDKGDSIKDIVVYNPSDCTVICLFGTVGSDALTYLQF